LNKGVLLTLKDERDGRYEEFKYDGGIMSYVEHLNRNSEKLHDEIVYIEREVGGTLVEVALQYNTGYQERILPSPTTSTPTREAPISAGSAPR